MESVPGAGRGPRAGSPRGVVDAGGATLANVGKDLPGMANTVNAGRNKMPPFTGVLSPEQIRDVLGYVAQELFAAKPSATAAPVVVKGAASLIRKITGSAAKASGAAVAEAVGKEARKAITGGSGFFSIWR